MNRVLIATWGNPFQWEPIWYRLDCKSLGIEDCQSVELRNVSTLPVLMKALRPHRTIVLVLDTLTNLTLRNDVKPKEVGSYEGAVEDVQERVKWFIENRVKPHLDEEDRALLDDVEVVVLPGVGEFDNVSVEGDVLDFYSVVLKVLAERLPVEDTEVILDLTHGINFMPVLTYRALKALLGILAYLHTVRLYVVNSEPFPQGQREWKEKIKELSVLNMKLVEARELRPRPLYSTISDRQEWSAFISSVTNGFPLAFATFYPSTKDVEAYVKKEYQDFLDAIEVCMKPDAAGERKAHILRRKALSRDFRTAVKRYYMLRVFGTVFNEYPKKEVTLDELFDISSKLFAKMPRIGIVVEDQLCELKNLQEWAVAELGRKRSRVPGGLTGKRGIALGELYRVRNQNFTSGGNSVNRNIKVRNFIAHSGFEFNTVSVKLEDTIRVKGGRAEKVFVFSYRDKGLASQLCVDALT
ncbi:MAG: CRISPR-associated CARF protein Csx1, partial [Thermococcus sp.]